MVVYVQFPLSLMNDIGVSFPKTFCVANVGDQAKSGFVVLNVSFIARDPEPTSMLKLLATYQGMRSSRTTRHDANGSKRVDGVAMLVESRPFEPSNTLRLRFRRREFDHLSFEVKLIARAHWGEPPQFVNAKAQQGMRSEWTYFHR